MSNNSTDKKGSYQENNQQKIMRKYLKMLDNDALSSSRLVKDLLLEHSKQELNGTFR